MPGSGRWARSSCGKAELSDGDLTRLLPHRPPILVLDRLVTVGEKTAVAEQEVGDGPHLVDGRLWAGGLIEGLAQTAALLNGHHLQASGDGEHVDLGGYLVGVRGLRIDRRPARGETVRYRVELIKRLGQLILVRGEARAGEELLASGQLKFFVRGADGP